MHVVVNLPLLNDSADVEQGAPLATVEPFVTGATVEQFGPGGLSRRARVN